MIADRFNTDPAARCATCGALLAICRARLGLPAPRPIGTPRRHARAEPEPLSARYDLDPPAAGPTRAIEPFQESLFG